MAHIQQTRKNPLDEQVTFEAGEIDLFRRYNAIMGAHARAKLRWNMQGCPTGSEPVMMAPRAALALAQQQEAA